MNKQKQAFTLVELIVVITILAILGTIAIMAFSGYSKNARDSARISDIANMKKGLELWILQSGTYPDPSSGTGITYSGATVWLQGSFGDSVTQTIGKLEKKPVDPLYNNEYTYSVTTSKKEYQIGAILEKDMAYSNPILPQTYAATIGEAYISGTYNGILTTIGTNPVYIIALPSIILSDLTVKELTNIATNALVYEGKTNLPSSYKVTGLTMTGTEFSFTPQVVWSGSSLTQLNTQTGFQDMVKSLQSVYTNNSIFASLPEYTSIVTGDTTPSTTTMSFVKELVQTNTNTQLTNVSNTYVSFAVNGVCGTAHGQTLADSSSITGNGACATGAPSSITGTGPWTWTCNGTNGGTNANCNASKTIPRGDQLYDITGTYNWLAPEGVTSVSVVCVGGGGGGRYNGAINNGGNSYFINTSVVAGMGGAGSCGQCSSLGGSFVGDGGGKGGDTGGSYFVSGGGAGGYSGAGGNGTGYEGTGNAGNGGGGASGGVGGNQMGSNGGGGGGVGLYGQGSSGAAGTIPGLGGYGGSLGENGSGMNGGKFGGAGGGGYAIGYAAAGGGLGYKNNIPVVPGNTYTVVIGSGGIGTNGTGNGGNGGCRIVWPGDTRQFPGTDVSQ